MNIAIEYPRQLVYDQCMQPIYLDYNSTTPLDPQVLEKMLPYLQKQFGNPASASHQWGWAAESAVKKARGQVAQLIGAQENEIVFTASATEANNMAILGLIHRLRQEDPLAPIHMITSQVEHASVTKVFEYARDFYGVEVDFIGVDAEGFVPVNEVARLIRPHTRLLSFIWVQNEIGTIQPMSELAKLAKLKKIYLHTDATQAVGKIPVDLNQVGVDLLTFSAHKFYGPKGVGVLYLRSQNPKVQIHPLIFGGGQEKNLRSGTLNVPAIVGCGEAAEISFKNLAAEMAQNIFLRNLLWNSLHEKISGLQLNGPPVSDERRSPNNLNITFQGRSLDRMLAFLPGLALSTGSACHSGTWSYSSTLRAIGLSDQQAQSSLRLSLGRFTTAQEIEAAVELLQKAAENQ